MTVETTGTPGHAGAAPRAPPPPPPPPPPLPPPPTRPPPPHPESVEQLLHESQSGGRPSIPPVEPGVDRHGQLVSPPELDGREEMLVQRMDPAGPDQPDEVQRAAALACACTQLDERGQAEELAGLDGLRDAHDVLRHDAAGAEVKVTHLAVADLPVGKSHGESGRVEERARRLGPEAMPDGRVTELDGVAFAAGTKAPAVEHDHDDRGARPTRLCHIGGDAI